MDDDTDIQTCIEVPAMSIPFPQTLSPEANGWLAFLAAMPRMVAPDTRDIEVWEETVGYMDAPELATEIGLATTGAVFDDSPTEDGEIVLSSARICTAVPGDLLRDDLVLLSLHGGGFTSGGGAACRASSRFVANSYGLRTWNVDYRMPPRHPYPAGLDDCAEAYRRLIREVGPARVVVGGLSGGAHMTSTLLLRMQDEGQPMPAAAILNSPPADALTRGDTMATNYFATTHEEGSLARLFRLYAGDASITDPYVSPIEGAVRPDWPRTILLSGTRDFLLSDTVRMHRKLLDAGVTAELHVFEGAPHGFFGGRTQEDRLPAEQIRRFILSLPRAD